MTLPLAIRKRLDPLIRRLASNHDGEILATVAAIERVLYSGDADWHDLAENLSGAGVKHDDTEARYRPRPQYEEHKNDDYVLYKKIFEIHELDIDVTAWEYKFLTDMLEYTEKQWGFSRKQAMVIERLHKKYVVDQKTS